MSVRMMKFVRRACAAASLVLTAGLLSAQQGSFDGTWQMDADKSHVSDGRVVTLTIAKAGEGISIAMKIRTKEGQELSSEVTSKLDGKACEFAEGDHKSKLTMWYNGPTLNASKEGGPAGDVTAMWKFELAPDKQTMTLKINHYEPARDDETLVFKKTA